MKTKLMKKFTFTYAELIQLVNVLIALLTRDLDLMGDYNIKVLLDKLKAKLKAFTAIPSDEVVLGQIMGIKKLRDKSENDVRAGINSILARFKSIFQNEPQKTHELGIYHISKQTHDEVYRSGLQILEFAKKYATELEAKGFTAAKTQEFGDKLAKLNDAITNYNIAITNRESITNDRKEVGNELFDLLSEGTRYGKDYWVNLNYVHYHEYVIYNGSAAAGTIELLVNQTAPGAIVLVSKGANTNSITISWGDGNHNKVLLSETTLSTTYNYTYAEHFNAIIKGDIGSLTMLHLDSCNLTGLNLPKKGVEKLIDISLANNQLNEEAVNSLLIKLNTFATSNGKLNLTMGTNAKPTGDGLKAIDELKKRSWTVEVN